MSDTVKKPTKKENYATIKEILTAAEEQGIVLDGATYEDLKAFLDKEVAALDKKTADAKKRAEKAKEQGDELREKVASVLNTEKYMTISEIVDAIGNPDVTAPMVISRLSQLAKANRVEKESTKIESTVEGGKSRTATTYRLVVSE